MSETDGDTTADGAGERRQSPELARLAEAVKAIERGAPAPAGSAPRPPAPRPPAADGPREPEVRARPAAPPAPLPDEPVEAARAALTRGGAPPELAEGAVTALGEGAGRLLAEDPWSILALPGVRPDQADGFARGTLGEECRPDDRRRGRALVGWLLTRAAEAGHTALEWSVLVGALARQAVPDAEEALRGAVEEGQVMVFQDARTAPAGGPGAAGEDEAPPVDVLLALDRYALAEESLADGLVRLLNTLPPGAAEEAAWPDLAAAGSPSAAELAGAVATSGLVAHSGAEQARTEPAALVAAARAAGLRAYAVAHTEDGRDRLATLLGEGGEQAALTVDELLTGAGGPARAEDGTLEVDLLAVLDAPQLDVERAASLVEAVPDGGRLVLSGDPSVVWSAGPGRVFADLLAAKVCPRVVSRTPDPGLIGELVSGIGAGELPAAGSEDREIVLVPVRDTGEAVHRAVQLVADSIPRAIGVPAAQTQVVTLTKDGAVGTRALNAALKTRLNPGPGRFAGFDPGDRVVHVPGPGPGSPGTVVSGGPEGLRVECGGRPLVVPPDRVEDEVRHGWAMTAQQAVGRRWPAVVVVVPGDAPATSPLTRQWVYTAFGRAVRHLSVVQGADRGLPRAVAEYPAKERTTRLRAILREQAPGSV